MHLLVEALNMHVISASWDLQYMSCLAESTRPKSFTLDVTALQKSGVLKNGEKVTKTGKLFYDTIKVRQVCSVIKCKLMLKSVVASAVHFTVEQSMPS